MQALTAFVVWVGLFVAFVILLCIPVWLLWNWLMPTIFSLPEITLLQSLGIMLLSSILFKSSK
jgi:hypothetical protein